MQSKYTPIQNIHYLFVCLFFASLNFEVFSPFVAEFSVAKMFAIAYIGVSFLTPVGQLFNVKSIKGVIVPFILMIFVMMLSSVFHYNIKCFDSSLFMNFIMMWLLLNHSRRDDRLFDDGLVWFAVSSALVGILYLCGVGIGYDGERLTMFGENENGMAIRMVSSILFLLNYCLNHTGEVKFFRTWLLLLIIPMMAVVLAAASRTSLAILIVGFIVFVILYPTEKRRTKPLILSCGIVILLLGLRFLQNQELIMERMMRAVEEGTDTSRAVIWSAYIPFIKDHLITGVGFDGWHYYSIERFGWVRSPHNVIIEVLLISGIIGLFFFLWIFIRSLRGAYMYYRRLKNIAPLLLSITAIALVLFGQALDIKFFWCIIAYCISQGLTEKRDKQTDQKYEKNSLHN